MAKIQLSRKVFTDKSTIGDIFFNGKLICSSLEDTIRNVKIAKETAIPAGDYRIQLRHSAKFNRIMPFLLDVPYFEGVMFHWGNHDGNSEGCILTGNYDEGRPDWISASRKSFDELFSLIEQSSNRGEELVVNIYGGLKREDFISAKGGTV